MPKKKRQKIAPRQPQSRKKLLVAIIIGALVLTVTGIFAQVGLQKKKPAASSLSPASLGNTDPAKEYIYAGGRLIATEEPLSGGCTYGINPSSQNFAAAGGTNNVTVTAGASCSWTAFSNAAWITVTSGSSGTGNGTVNYSVSANSGSQRTGTMTIANQTFTVTQDAGGGSGSCSTAVSVSPSVVTITSAAQSGPTVTVGASPAGCSWTAADDASWLTITSGSSGSGGGTITYSVTQNTTGATRTGHITVTGAPGITATHTVKQNP